MPATPQRGATQGASGAEPSILPISGASAPEFPYIFTWDRKGRKGQKCRTLRRGGMNSAAIEFEDGYQMVTSRNSLRRAAGFALAKQVRRRNGGRGESPEQRHNSRSKAANYASLPDSAVEARSGSCDIT